MFYVQVSVNISLNAISWIFGLLSSVAFLCCFFSSPCGIQFLFYISTYFARVLQHFLKIFFMFFFYFSVSMSKVFLFSYIFLFSCLILRVLLRTLFLGRKRKRAILSCCTVYCYCYFSSFVVLIVAVEYTHFSADISVNVQKVLAW